MYACMYDNLGILLPHLPVWRYPLPPVPFLYSSIVRLSVVSPDYF